MFINELFESSDDMFAAPKVTARKLAALMHAGKEIWVKDSRNEVWKINKIEPDPLNPKRLIAHWDFGEFVVGDDEYRLAPLEPDESAYLLKPTYRVYESADDMFAPALNERIGIALQKLATELRQYQDSEQSAWYCNNLGNIFRSKGLNKGVWAWHATRPGSREGGIDITVQHVIKERTGFDIADHYLNLDPKQMRGESDLGESDDMFADSERTSKPHAAIIVGDREFLLQSKVKHHIIDYAEEHGLKIYGSVTDAWRLEIYFGASVDGIYPLVLELEEMAGNDYIVTVLNGRWDVKAKKPFMSESDDDMFSTQRPPAIQTSVAAGLDWLVAQYYDQMQEITGEIEMLYPDEVEDYDDQISELKTQLETARELHDIAETLSVTLDQDGWLTFIKLRNNLNNDNLPTVLSDLNNYLKSSGVDIDMHNIGNPMSESDDDMFAPGPSVLVRAKQLLDKSKSIYIAHPYYDNEVLPVFSIYVDENTPHRYSDSVTILLKNWRHIEHDINADEWKLEPFANGFLLKKKASNEDAEVLDEGATSVLYHYTSPMPALRIMKSGEFELASSVGSPQETKFAPKGYPYFMSTTRSKVGDYHARVPGSHAVMFVLDGTKLAHNYKVKPVDYWEGMWQQDNSNERTREAEDRVYSKTPTIPTAGIIKEIHQLVTDQDEFRSPAIRQMAIIAKTQGIPIYFYADKQGWLLQAPNRRFTVSQLPNRFKGPAKTGMARSSRRITPLEQWVELLYKKNKSELSQEASQLRHNLVYYGSRYPLEDSQLGIDLANARKPNDPNRALADRLIQYMRKHNLTTVDLKNAMAAKWDKTT